MRRLCIDEDTSDKVCAAMRKLRPRWDMVFVRQWSGSGIKDPMLLELLWEDQPNGRRQTRQGSFSLVSAADRQQPDALPGLVNGNNSAGFQLGGELTQGPDDQLSETS